MTVSAFRILALVGASFAVSAGTLAQTDPKPAATAGAPATKSNLSVGDPAPALTIGHWVKGEPVKSFEKGHVYVVEFWATWCVPCIRGMPHLTELQQHYKDKKVTIIGISGMDKRGIEDVRPFMEKRGASIGYTIAVDDQSQTVAAYMGATGRDSIPVAYIVDKQGKLAWYGHPSAPMDAMDLVLDEVVNDTFDASRHAERMTVFRASSEKFGKATQEQSWDDAIKALDEMKGVRPDLKTDFEVSRFAVLRVGKQDKAAAKAVRERLEREFGDDLPSLRKLSQAMVGVPEADDDEKKAATALAKTVVEKGGEKDPVDLTVLAQAYRNQEDWDAAIASMRKSVEKSSDEATRQNMQAALDKMERERPKQQTADPTGTPAGTPVGDKPKDK